MSSQLDVGEISTYDGNVTVISKDILQVRNTINSVEHNYNGITVSMSMEQNEELRCVTSALEQNIVDMTVDDSATGAAEKFSAFHTLLMSHKRTTQITTVTSLEKNPLEIEIDVLFSDDCPSSALETYDEEEVKNTSSKPASTNSEPVLMPKRLKKDLKETVWKSNATQRKPPLNLALKARGDNKLMFDRKTAQSASKIKKPSPRINSFPCSKRSTLRSVSTKCKQKSVEEKKNCLAIETVVDSITSSDSSANKNYSTKITDTNLIDQSSSQVLKLCKFFPDGKLRKMCRRLYFLNEDQLKTLQDLNVHRPEDTLNLTLGQLNSIGIQKGDQLEAILGIALNRQELECCNNSVTSNDDGDDSEQPLVIDKTFELNEPEDQTVTKSGIVNTGGDHDYLDADIFENEIRKAITEVDKRLKKVKNSNAPHDAKIKEVQSILNKLNELDIQYKMIKTHSNHELLYKPQQTDNRVDEANQKLSDVARKDLHSGNEENTSAKVAEEKHFRREGSSELVQNENSEVLKNELKDQSNHCTQINATKTVEHNVHNNMDELETSKVFVSNDMQYTNGDKMTLRSERKVINMSNIKSNKIAMEKNVKKSPTKVVLGDVKNRRLKLPKCSISQDSIKSVIPNRAKKHSKPSTSNVSNGELAKSTPNTSDYEEVKEINKKLNDTYFNTTNNTIMEKVRCNQAISLGNIVVEKKINESLSNSTSKSESDIDFEMKSNGDEYWGVNKTESSTILSPIPVEISSPSYPSLNSLSDYTPAKEIDGHMKVPPMFYCLHEIIIPNTEKNKPDNIHKLLRSSPVDPRLLKYKEKNCVDVHVPQKRPYIPSGHISQYDPRQRKESSNIPYRIHNQNTNMLLYNYLQKSPWYQTQMSTMKMQINHSIAELVRALNNFHRERLMDATAVFDIFKIDCAGELIEIMRNLGIFIDSNGYIAETHPFKNYETQMFNNSTPSSSTYSFISQTLSSPHTQLNLQCYAKSIQSTMPIVMSPPVTAPPFVSSSPSLSPMTQRRHCGTMVPFDVPSKTTAPPPTVYDEEESWDSPPASPKPKERIGSKYEHRDKYSSGVRRNGRTPERNGRHGGFFNYRRNRY